MADNYRNRPIVMGQGETTFVDMKDLKPQNEVTATLAGGLFGAVVGSIPMIANDFSSPTKLKIAFAAVATVAGAIISYGSARTHNKWADRMTDKMIDNQKPSNVQVS